MKHFMNLAERSDKVFFKGSVENLTLPSWHRGSLEKTVPLNGCFLIRGYDVPMGNPNPGNGNIDPGIR